MQEKRWSGGPGLCRAGLGWAGLGWSEPSERGIAGQAAGLGWAELGWTGQGLPNPKTAGTAGQGSAACPVSTADAEAGCSRTSPSSCTCRKAPIGVGHALFVLSDDQLTRIFHSANNALCCASQLVCVSSLRPNHHPDLSFECLLEFPVPPTCCVLCSPHPRVDSGVACSLPSATSPSTTGQAEPECARPHKFVASVTVRKGHEENSA